MKEFADDNFKFDENGRKSIQMVENIAGKGEIAHDEQFLYFPQYFQKTCSADTWKPGLVWERVKYFTKQSNLLGKLRKFLKRLWKNRILWQFSRFPGNVHKLFEILYEM